jgi:glucose dehydrogenase
MTLQLVVAIAATVSSLLAPLASAQVTFERLLKSSEEPQNWLTYSGDYEGHRFSALDQINTSNASSLVPKWAYQTMAGGKFETTEFCTAPGKTTASSHWMLVPGAQSGSTSGHSR